MNGSPVRACELPPALRAKVVRMSQRVLAELENTRRIAVEEGAEPRVVDQIISIAKHEANRQIAMAAGIVKLARIS